MVSMLALSVVDHSVEPCSGQIKYNQIRHCCFSAHHTVLRSKSKDSLAQNQDNVFGWIFVFVSYKNPTKLVGLVQSRHHHNFI